MFDVKIETISIWNRDNFHDFQIFEVLDIRRVIHVIQDYTVKPFLAFGRLFFVVHFYSVDRNSVSNPNRDEISNLDFYQSRLDVENLHQIDMFSDFFIFLLFYWHWLT